MFVSSGKYVFLPSLIVREFCSITDNTIINNYNMQATSTHIIYNDLLSNSCCSFRAICLNWKGDKKSINYALRN